MPRFFSTPILATIDMPMALVVFRRRRVLRRDEQPPLAWIAGLAMALAFLTKINAIALPFVLWPWGIYFFGRPRFPRSSGRFSSTPALFFARGLSSGRSP